MMSIFCSPTESRLTLSLLRVPTEKRAVALATPSAAPARQEEVYNALSNGQVAAATL
jgi:hypothetical protein